MSMKCLILTFQQSDIKISQVLKLIIIIDNCISTDFFSLAELSDSTKRTVLEKKFEAYDIFKDNQLSNIEQHHFMEELFQFVKCHTFREQISDIFGSHLDLNMWIEFFDYDHMEGTLSS